LQKIHQRLIFLDVLRGLAVLWMIETHVVNLTLPPDWHTQGWLSHLLYMSNGYVAEAFAFCAGASFWLASQKNESGKYFWRFLFILGVGYWLNATPFSLHYILRASPLEHQQMAQCDILQVIGYSSLIALFIFRWKCFQKIFPWLSGFIALVIFLITPLEWTTPIFRSLPTFFSMLLSPIPPAKFPLFPWMGYFFAGVSLMSFLGQSKNPQRFSKWVGLIALAAPWLIFHVKDMNFTCPGTAGPFVEWYPSPGHSLFRLSGVVFIYCLFYLFNNPLKALSSKIRFFQISGQESLQIYVSQTLILYGLAIHWNLSQYTTPWMAPAIFILVSLFCFLLATTWHTFKKKFPHPASALIKVMVVAVGILFFV